MAKSKLTEAQVELLRCTALRDQYVVSSYKPAHKLKTLGLVSTEDRNPPFGLIVRITPAGRLALSDQTKEPSRG